MLNGTDATPRSPFLLVPILQHLLSQLNFANQLTRNPRPWNLRKKKNRCDTTAVVRGRSRQTPFFIAASHARARCRLSARKCIGAESTGKKKMGRYQPSHLRHRPDVLLVAAFAPTPPSRLPWSGGCPIGNLSRAALRVLLLHPEGLAFPLSGRRERAREIERGGGKEGGRKFFRPREIQGARQMIAVALLNRRWGRGVNTQQRRGRYLLPVGSGLRQRQKTWRGGGHVPCSIVAASVPSALAVCWPW